MDDVNINELGPQAEQPGRTIPLRKLGCFAPPPRSGLTSLWAEWQALFPQLDTKMELFLASSEAEIAPLTLAQLNLEAKKVSSLISVSANERYHMTHASDGLLTGQADAKPFVHISLNRMIAWMCVFPPINGGEHIKMEQLESVLQNHLISAGIDQAALHSIVNQRRYFQFVIIARGKTAVRGVNGYVEEFYTHSFKEKQAKEEEEKKQNGEEEEEWPSTKEDDEFDFTTSLRVGYVQNVPAKARLCRLVPPQRGKPGVDVLGTEIPCVHGSPATLVGGPNTKLTEDGYLIAEMEGALFYQNGRFYVQPLYIVTGSLTVNESPVHFDGDVEILGDVLENTIVKATGSVTIKGLMEAAMITSGKDVIITGGILGDNRAVIRAQGKVQAKYMEYCVVYAGDDVRVGDAIASQIYSNGKINVRGGRGTVIGGTLVAPYEISAKVIGSRAECATDIRLGEFPCAALREQEYDEQIESIRVECIQLDRTIAQLEMMDSDGQKIPLVKARLRRSSLQFRIEQLLKEKAELQTRCETFVKCKLRADTMYPAARITIGDSSYTMEDRHDFCSASYSTAREEITVRWMGGGT